MDNSIIKFFSENGYEITSNDDYLTIKKVKENNGCLTIIIISISVFGMSYFFIGVYAIVLSILALVVYFIDSGSDYTKVVFDYSGNRLYLTLGSIYTIDKVYYLSDVEEIKLVTKKFDSFTSAFKAGNKDYVRNIVIAVKSINLVILSIVSDSDITDVEFSSFVSILNERVK